MRENPQLLSDVLTTVEGLRLVTKLIFRPDQVDGAICRIECTNCSKKDVFRQGNDSMLISFSFNEMSCRICRQKKELSSALISRRFSDEELEALEGSGIVLAAKVEPASVISKLERFFGANYLALANKYFRSALKTENGSYCRDYIRDRGLTEAAISAFQVGYAPDSWHELLEYICNVDQNQGNQTNRDTLIEIGLIRRHSETNNEYDFFRNRLIFPILSIRNEVLGFTARTLDGSEPKYINTPNHGGFTKGSMVYGINQAYQSILISETVYIVEGCLDVVMMHQFGLTNTIAPLGTAITKEQLSGLFKIGAKKLVVVLDGDNAGRSASDKVVDTYLELRASGESKGILSFVELPERYDPDSLLRSENGREKMESLLSNTTVFSGKLVDRLLNKYSWQRLDGQAAIISKLAPFFNEGDSFVRNSICASLDARVPENEAKIAIANLWVSAEEHDKELNQSE